MPIIPNHLRAIKNFTDLMRYLEDELDWPLQGYPFDDIVFEYSPGELGLRDEDAAKVKTIHQLRPLHNNQPWGIFFVEFEKKRMPVVVLRRILSHLVIKKRAAANKEKAATWDQHDLLFISAFGAEDSEQREIAFAHFHQESGDLPTLKVLGWDGADTPLKLEYVADILKEKLRWPDDAEDMDAWREEWSGAFQHKIGHVIRTADMLADRLAELARRIREAAKVLMAHETENGALRRLHKAFQTALLHDLKEADFADTYAQTITYGLLTAAISRTEMSAGRYGTALVAGNVTDMVPITNPFLREMLETFLQAGGRKGGIDFDELGIQDVVDLLRGDETDLPAVLRDFGNRAPGEDPVIHFYEHFLSAYNKQLKIQRGVFYTPKPVVSYIVRSVHELLQSEFGIEDGLASTITWGEMAEKHPDLKIPEGTPPASPFVQILDPATGTATFLVEVIDVIHRTLKTKWQNQRMSEPQQQTAWNDYVPKHLLPRLHGYELMMAPYAIAHMKVPLKLKETGFTAWATLSDKDRVRIYLTNALEPASDDYKQKTFADWTPALSHEAQSVNAIKRQQRFTIVIGNPPYSQLSNNLASDVMEMVEPYKYINGERIYERGALSLQKNLQNDYVKFIRLSEQVVEYSGFGIIGLITDNSYLDGRSFRGMRYHLSKSFDNGWILDLHGSGKKDEFVNDGTDRDANVFDIMQGVAITLWTRRQKIRTDCSINRADLLGTRESKYFFLSTNTMAKTIWKQLQLAPPFFLYILQDLELLKEYQTYMSLREIFPVYSSGIKTHRNDFAYSFTQQEANQKLMEFCNPDISNQDLRIKYGLKDTNIWALDNQRRKAILVELLRFVQPVFYLPFDVRITCFSNEIIELSRHAIMDQILNTKNLALLCSQQQAEEGFRHVFCTRLISDCCSVSNKTRETTSVFPLWLIQPINNNLQQYKLNFKEGIQPNVHPIWLNTFGSPYAIFNFVYALLHSPLYRERYATFLRSDFPHLPITSNQELIHDLCAFGEQLVALHLMESPRLEHLITRFTGWGDSTVATGHPKYSDGKVWINPQQAFEGVPSEVWEFHIGGYQVCHKWLKDRKGRQLSEEDIVHYQKIVVAVNETRRLMEEIDGVIEEHGGWPIQ